MVRSESDTALIRNVRLVEGKGLRVSKDTMLVESVTRVQLTEGTWMPDRGRAPVAIVRHDSGTTVLARRAARGRTWITVGVIVLVLIGVYAAGMSQGTGTIY